jgi:hypothetical protein
VAQNFLIRFRQLADPRSKNILTLWFFIIRVSVANKALLFDE